MSFLENEDEIYFAPFKKHESILNNKNEPFANKVESLIDIWKTVGELDLSQFDLRHVVQIMDWAKLHALNIILTAEWEKFKDDYKTKLIDEIETAQERLLKVNDSFATRCKKLVDVVKNPWEDAMLMKLMKTKNIEINSEVIDFFRIETAYLVSVRLTKLCEAHCEDFALNLVTAFMNCEKLSKEQNFTLNLSETQLWFIFDIYIALLYKYQEKQKIVLLLKELSFDEGLQLVKRFTKKRVKIAKIWKNCQRVAVLALQMYISQAVVKYTDDLKDVLRNYLEVYLSLCNTDVLLQDFTTSIRRISNLADASGLYLFCDVVEKMAGSKLKPFVIEMYIRALTTDMNELERQKDAKEDEKAQATTSRLAAAFCNLAEFLNEHLNVARECVLTAFSLEPTKERLKSIEEFASKSGFEVLDTGQEWKCRLHPPALPSDEITWVCSECGGWMCKPQLNLPKINMTLNEALQTSVLGISEALCDDLVVCLSNPRYQILSWFLPWEDLHRLCLMYLQDPQNTKNFVTELKFVDIDYSIFKGIKKEPVDDLAGIERGYEQYLDHDFVSGDESSSDSEDSMSQDSRPYSLGSDGAGDNFYVPLIPPVQQKSDPNTLKSLRMFRPSMKRKDKEPSDVIPEKIPKQGPSNTITSDPYHGLTEPPSLSQFLNGVAHLPTQNVAPTQDTNSKNVKTATLPLLGGQVAKKEIKSIQVHLQNIRPADPALKPYNQPTNHNTSNIPKRELTIRLQNKPLLNGSKENNNHLNSNSNNKTQISAQFQDIKTYTRIPQRMNKECKVILTSIDKLATKVPPQTSPCQEETAQSKILPEKNPEPETPIQTPPSPDTQVAVIPQNQPTTVQPSTSCQRTQPADIHYRKNCIKPTETTPQSHCNFSNQESTPLSHQEILVDAPTQTQVLKNDQNNQKSQTEKPENSEVVDLTLSEDPPTRSIEIDLTRSPSPGKSRPFRMVDLSRPCMFPFGRRPKENSAPLLTKSVCPLHPSPLWGIRKAVPVTKKVDTADKAVNTCQELYNIQKRLQVAQKTSQQQEPQQRNPVIQEVFKNFRRKSEEKPSTISSLILDRQPQQPKLDQQSSTCSLKSSTPQLITETKQISGIPLSTAQAEPTSNNLKTIETPVTNQTQQQMNPSEPDQNQPRQLEVVLKSLPSWNQNSPQQLERQLKTHENQDQVQEETKNPEKPSTNCLPNSPKSQVTPSPKALTTSSQTQENPTVSNMKLTKSSTSTPIPAHCSQNQSNCKIEQNQSPKQQSLNKTLYNRNPKHCLVNNTQNPVRTRRLNSLLKTRLPENIQTNQKQPVENARILVRPDKFIQQESHQSRNSPLLQGLQQRHLTLSSDPPKVQPPLIPPKQLQNVEHYSTPHSSDSPSFPKQIIPQQDKATLSKLSHTQGQMEPYRTLAVKLTKLSENTKPQDKEKLKSQDLNMELPKELSTTTDTLNQQIQSPKQTNKDQQKITSLNQKQWQKDSCNLLKAPSPSHSSEKLPLQHSPLQETNPIPVSVLINPKEIEVTRNKMSNTPKEQSPLPQHNTDQTALLTEKSSVPSSLKENPNQPEGKMSPNLKNQQLKLQLQILLRPIPSPQLLPDPIKSDSDSQPVKMKLVRTNSDLELSKSFQENYLKRRSCCYLENVNESENDKLEREKKDLEEILGDEINQWKTGGEVKDNGLFYDTADDIDVADRIGDDVSTNKVTENESDVLKTGELKDLPDNLPKNSSLTDNIRTYAKKVNKKEKDCVKQLLYKQRLKTCKNVNSSCNILPHSNVQSMQNKNKELIVVLRRLSPHRTKTSKNFKRKRSHDKSENKPDKNFNSEQNMNFSPLQDINCRISPKVFPNSCCDVNKPNGIGLAEKLSPDKKPVDIEKKLSDNNNYARSILANVPGLNDFEMIRPTNVDQIVNVVQVSGTRVNQNVSIQNTQTSTQVTPHIQRIGQPRIPDAKPEQSATTTVTTTTVSTTVTTTTKSATTTSQPSTLINILSQQVVRPVAQTNVLKRTPSINILSQQILRPLATTKAPNVVVVSQSNQAKPVTTSTEATIINTSSTTSKTAAAVKTVNTVTPGHGSAILQFICKSSLPKFQQAFGKTVYQNSTETADSTTSNAETATTTTSVETKKTTITKAVPVNVQPLQGSVIYSRQVPVGQTISLIPPGGTTRQVFRIATTNPEQLLVKDTVIHSKMSALLAAALQGRAKTADGTEVQINCDEATKVTLTRPTLVQNARIVKPVQLQLPTNLIRNAPQPNLSSTTLEQLREFDMVYKQIKERSNTSTPAENAGSSADTQESTPPRISVTYVNQLPKYTQLSPVVVVTSYSALQSAASPALSVTSQGSSSPCLTPSSTPTLPKITTKTSKGKTLKTTVAPASNSATTATVAVKVSPTIPKPQQKPQEDEHTTQRIFDILAEYAEQLRNSPDLNNKPAPRRRSNPPTNPNQSSKRKKSSSSAKKPGQSSSGTLDMDTDDITVGSEDSSGGNIIQLSVTDDEQSQAATVTTPESNENSSSSSRQLILSENSTLNAQPTNVIIADSSVGEALKMSSTVIVPGNYIMPVSMVKGGQQIAVVSGASKILATVPARQGQNMLLLQSFPHQNRKSAISAVKYSTLQQISGISSQTLAGVSAQPPVILPPNSVATAVALGQPLTLKKIGDDNETSEQLVLTISPAKEPPKLISDVPLPDSSTNATPDSSDIKNEEVKAEAIKIEDETLQTTSSTEKIFQKYQKTVINSVGTSVIATAIKQEDASSNINVSLPSDSIKAYVRAERSRCTTGCDQRKYPILPPWIF